MDKDIDVIATRAPEAVVLAQPEPFPVVLVIVLLLVLGAIGIGIYVYKSEPARKKLKKLFKKKIAEIQASAPVSGKVTYTYKDPRDPDPEAE